MNEEVITGWKFIQSDRTSRHGNHKWKINKWYKYNGDIELCKAGFHACLEPIEAFNYVYGNLLCEVEARGEIIHEYGDKFVASEMRIVRIVPEEILKRISVEYGIKCAWHVLKNYEKEFPDDKRPRRALQAAKRVLKNPSEENIKELEAARRPAWLAAKLARSATDSAESAALSTTRAAGVIVAERSNAEFVARSAAWSAQSAARSAWSAEKAIEREWQNKTLKKLLEKHTDTENEKLEDVE